MNDKLMFVLCRTCGETNNTEICNHTRAERALQGTWVLDEVRKALEMGYTMITVYEIWKYETAKFSSEDEGLFTSFINRFLKMKQEASGWPSNCTNHMEKEQYISDYLNNEKIELEFSQIVKNSGRRSLAKLILNSFWGKFGQRENQAKTSIVRHPHELFDMLANTSIDINNILDVNDTTVVVNWEYKDEAADSLPTVNVCIAAFTTAQARLKLYSYLEKLNKRVLYYDTDSVIYVSNRDVTAEEYEPKTGPFLGDMTDELEGEYGPGSYITEFLSGGPKNYGYEVYSTKKQKIVGVCKIKGFSLNYETSLLLNLNTMKTSILADDRVSIPTTSRNIRITKEHAIVTVEQTKVYNCNSTKRKFLEDHSSLPYGYKKIN
jgi:hypothetical protein